MSAFLSFSLRACVAHTHFDWPLQVPPGHVWLEGDNPKESLDSRYYGPVPLALIQGRVTHQVCHLQTLDIKRSMSFCPVLCINLLSALRHFASALSLWTLLCLILPSALSLCPVRCVSLPSALCH